MEECLVFYRNKYGTFQNVDNYVVYFIPNLVIMKKDIESRCIYGIIKFSIQAATAGI